MRWQNTSDLRLNITPYQKTAEYLTWLGCAFGPVSTKGLCWQNAFLRPTQNVERELAVSQRNKFKFASKNNRQTGSLEFTQFLGSQQKRAHIAVLSAQEPREANSKREVDWSSIGDICVACPSFLLPYQEAVGRQHGNWIYACSNDDELQLFHCHWFSSSRLIRRNRKHGSQRRSSLWRLHTGVGLWSAWKTCPSLEYQHVSAMFTWLCQLLETF